MSVRVLIADDEPQLLAVYRDCFACPDTQGDELAALGASLFAGTGEMQGGFDFSGFRFDYVSQGEDAIARVATARAEGDPYAMLFLDMRMPPGIDGYETAARIRERDDRINIVIVTGYSDHDPLSIARVAGPLDQLFYVSKPFKTADIQQLAQSLAARWNLDRELRRTRDALAEKLAEIEKVNVELAASEARSRHIALHDHLTRLPNRTQFHEFLERAIQLGKSPVAVLLLDLDHFKNVNDTLGHPAGDELIRLMADSLRQEIPARAILARLGGDEFAIALDGADEDEVQVLARRLVEKCGGEFTIASTKVFVGASVGISIRQGDDLGVSELLRRADLALYAAKRSGRNAARLFCSTMDESARMRSRIECRLREALDKETLRLVYQPIVSPDDGSVYGYEALLRWTDDELGEVPPALFVPVAEQSGLACTLGEWVIRNAIAECARWPQGVVSINISTHHFQSRELVDYVTSEAAAHGLPHERIQFEITETAMFTNPRHAAEVITHLRGNNIRIALDDFGTGYSSLVNLRDFELDCIKIDKSFVETLGEDHQASAIITSVTAMARLLGLNVVAEGVESESQVQALRLLGCGMMQGYFFSRPMAPDTLPFAPLVADEGPRLAQPADHAPRAA